jgi:hypothetical protein
MSPPARTHPLANGRPACAVDSIARRRDQRRGWELAGDNCASTATYCTTPRAAAVPRVVITAAACMYVITPIHTVRVGMV